MRPGDIQVGHVLRYDFLWPHEHKQGLQQGKDRPCAVVITLPAADQDSRTIYVCPITHSPPDNEYAVQLPDKLKRSLGLDDLPCWVKTDHINAFVWPERTIPYGITRTANGEFAYGILPYAIREKITEQIRKAIKAGKSQSIART